MPVGVACGTVEGFGAALASQRVLLLGVCACGYWCLVPVSTQCVAEECTLFLSSSSVQHGQELALPGRSPETGTVKVGVRSPCSA